MVKKIKVLTAIGNENLNDALKKEKEIEVLQNDIFYKEGVIEFSDEYKFLEDQRTYKIKTYGVGRAIDENSALVLDISGLEEAVIPVKVKGTVATKEQA